MAIYHFSVDVIRRASGRSSVAAAYRAAQKLINEREGMLHDYTRKRGVVYSEIMLPWNAPGEYNDKSGSGIGFGSF